MRNAGGYALICDPCAPVVEFDTFTCRHCDRIVHVKPRENPEDIGGMCGSCSGLICGPCTDVHGCMPLEKRLEAFERRADTLRSYGIG